MKQKLSESKGEMESSIIVGAFNTPFSIMDIAMRQINKNLS